MPRPRLLFASRVVIEQLDRSATVYDEFTREPVGNPDRTTTYTVRAQRWNVHRQQPGWDVMGPEEQRRGWLTFNTRDIAAAGYTPKIGDRVVRFGRKTVELYLNQIEPIGHYEDGEELTRAYFSDRRPAASGPSDGGSK